MQRRQLKSFSPLKAELQKRISKKRFALHTSTEYLNETGLACQLSLPIPQLVASYRLATGSYVEWDDVIEDRNRGRQWSDFIHLYPCPDGNYEAALAFALDREESQSRPKPVY